MSGLRRGSVRQEETVNGSGLVGGPSWPQEGEAPGSTPGMDALQPAAGNVGSAYLAARREDRCPGPAAGWGCLAGPSRVGQSAQRSVRCYARARLVAPPPGGRRWRGAGGATAQLLRGAGAAQQPCRG